MVERLRSSIERGLWKGPDIVIAEDVIVDYNYSAQVPVLIAKDSFPQSPYLVTPWLAEHFLRINENCYPSVRSRYAQIGLNIRNGVIAQIGEWLSYNVHLSDYNTSDYNSRYSLNGLSLPITVNNHGSRPIRLEKGAHLFRFFEESYGSFLEGDELVDAVKEGLIKIKGESFGDWIYSYGMIPGHNLPRPDGMFIRINSQNRRWIPPHPENKPIFIPDSGERYREVIDSLLEPVAQEKYRKILWIGETIKITLTPPIDAILDTVAIRGINTDKDIMDQSTWGTQLNSRLIDGGKTDWAVRVEIISATSPDRIPHFVHLGFVKGTR